MVLLFWQLNSTPEQNISFAGYYETWPATAETNYLWYCYFGNWISPQKKIYPFMDRLTLGLQQLGHQIQGIAILAIEFHPRTKYMFLRTL